MLHLIANRDPLYKPCICAGTIAFVHQQCLEATIAEKRSNKCPVCKYTYQFRPKYVENAPEHLSKMEVISGLFLRAGNKWLPLSIRLLLVFSVWLVILPLFTSYFYQAWMHKPSSMSSRLDKKFLFSDIVSGMMITATIVITFLAMLSLVEHFRFNWQPQRQVQRNEEEMRREQQQQQQQQQQQADQQLDDNHIIEDEFPNEEIMRFLGHVKLELNDMKHELAHKNDNGLGLGLETSEEEDDFIVNYPNNPSDKNRRKRPIIEQPSSNNISEAMKRNSFTRKSIGVMDEGQTIFSDDMATTNASTTTPLKNNIQHQHDDEGNDHQDLPFANIIMDDAVIDHDLMQFDFEDEKMTVTGIPNRRRRKRRSISRKILASMDIDDEHDIRTDWSNGDLTSADICKSKNAAQQDSANEEVKNDADRIQRQTPPSMQY